MDFGKFIDEIGGEEYREAVLSCPVEEKLLDLFYCDFTAFEKAGREKDDSALFFLSAYTRLAYNAMSEGLRRGIPESVLIATFADITTWEKWYRRKRDKAGLDRIGWLRNHLSFRIFRLGELQFEITNQTWNGFELYMVHVPEGAVLDKAEDSFSASLSFFRKDEAAFAIESWLLSPEINSFLPQSSSIRRFSSLFTLCRTEESRQAEERIFGFIAEDPAQYVASTSLAEKVKSYLLAGGRIENGYGVLVRPIR